MGIVINPLFGSFLTKSGFNNAVWRSLLSQIGQHLDKDGIGIEVISPFGFELLEDRTYLAKSLRRFYAYIGVPKGQVVDEIDLISQYRETLLNTLRVVDQTMFEDIVIVIEGDRLKRLKPNDYQCQPTDKLLDIQLRYVETDILTDYANYIIAALAGLYHEKGEGADYQQNRMRRWRLFQLYIIQEQLFGYLLPSFTVGEQALHQSIFQLTSNMIQFFYDPTLLFMGMTEEESVIISELVKPRIAAMYEAIQPRSPSTRHSILCYAYHYNDQLCLTIDQAIYWQALNKIKRTYLAFG